MNTVKAMIGLIRANRSLAMVAGTLDALIGAIVGAVVYMILNSQGVSFGTLGVMIFTALLAIGGLVAIGYNHFRTEFYGADELEDEIQD